MSHAASDWAWKRTTAKGSDLIVLLALADQADDDGVCYPSVKYLAAKVRLDRATVLRRLNVLEAAGLVTRNQREGRSTEYRLNMHEGGSQNATPTPSEGVAPVRRGGRTDATGGSHGCDTEPSLNRHSTKRAREGRRAPETKLPESWAPNDAHRAFAAERHVDVEAEAFAFRAHAEANDRRQRRWDAAFRLWLSKARPAPRSQWDRAVNVRDLREQFEQEEREKATPEERRRIREEILGARRGGRR